MFKTPFNKNQYKYVSMKNNNSNFPTGMPMNFMMPPAGMMTQ